MKQEERMDEAIENGLDYAIARKDTFWLLPVSYTHLDVYKRQV